MVFKIYYLNLIQIPKIKFNIFVASKFNKYFENEYRKGNKSHC